MQEKFEFEKVGHSNMLRMVFLAFLLAVSRTTATAAEATNALDQDPDGVGKLAEKFCSNISDAARDARVYWQSQRLKKLSEDLDKRMKLVKSETAKLKAWVTKRDEFVRKGNENLIRIFSGMRPDAAAQQLVSLQEMTAAAILMRLEARTASSILNEMDPKNAARLTSIIAGAADYDQSGGGS